MTNSVNLDVVGGRLCPPVPDATLAGPIVDFTYHFTRVSPCPQCRGKGTVRLEYNFGDTECPTCLGIGLQGVASPRTWKPARRVIHRAMPFASLVLLHYAIVGRNVRHGKLTFWVHGIDGESRPGSPGVADVLIRVSNPRTTRVDGKPIYVTVDSSCVPLLTCYGN